MDGLEGLEKGAVGRGMDWSRDGLEKVWIGRGIVLEEGLEKGWIGAGTEAGMDRSRDWSRDGLEEGFSQCVISMKVTLQ